MSTFEKKFGQCCLAASLYVLGNVLLMVLLSINLIFIDVVTFGISILAVVYAIVLFLIIFYKQDEME